MNGIVVTLSAPPFDYRSPWWWCMDRVEVDVPLHLVTPSPMHQFQREEREAGTVHRLNVYADPDTPWDERERVEFAVKCYVYLSKMIRRGGAWRIVVADCDGVEALVAANLSVLAPVWVKAPEAFSSERGRLGRPMLKSAERVFGMSDVAGEDYTPEWTPDRERWTRIFRNLFEVGE